jgi:hypothetical protein
MAGISPFGRLIRFENQLGEIKYGELATESPNSLVGSTVEVYNGDFPWNPGFQNNGETDIVHKVGDAQSRILDILATNSSRLLHLCRTCRLSSVLA